MGKLLDQMKNNLKIGLQTITDPVGIMNTIAGVGKGDGTQANTTNQLVEKVQNTPSPIEDNTSVEKNILNPANQITQGQWDREDKIRKETQEREDSAYQRAVEDMRKAGINPNLVGINPAGSGGGITNASGEQTKNTIISEKFNESIQKIKEELNLKENEKERFQNSMDNLLSSVIGIFDVG